MRVLCLLFQRLPIELALRARPALRGRPLALIAGHGGDALVTAATADLTARGIIPGMPAIEARERAPEARFAPDNAGACLDELERVSAIVRAKASPFVEVGGREHLFVDISRLASGALEEMACAHRLAAIVANWTRVAVRAGVASTRGDALEAARAARRAPQVYPSLLDSGEPPIAPFREERIAATIRLAEGGNELARRAAMERLARKLDLVLASRRATTRAVTVATDASGARHETGLRLQEPAGSVAGLADAIARAIPAGEGAVEVSVCLGRLGPDVRVPRARERVGGGSGAAGGGGAVAVLRRAG